MTLVVWDHSTLQFLQLIEVCENSFMHMCCLDPAMAFKKYWASWAFTFSAILLFVPALDIIVLLHDPIFGLVLAVTWPHIDSKIFYYTEEFIVNSVTAKSSGPGYRQAQIITPKPPLLTVVWVCYG